MNQEEIETEARERERQDARDYEREFGYPPSENLREITRRWYIRHIQDREARR